MHVSHHRLSERWLQEDLGTGSRATTPISHLPATHSGVIKGPTRAHGKRAGEVHLVVVIEDRTCTTWQRLKIDHDRRRLLPALLLSTFPPQRHPRPGGQRKRWPKPGGAERRDERTGRSYTRTLCAAEERRSRCDLQFASPRRLRKPLFLLFSCAFPILHSLSGHTYAHSAQRHTFPSRFLFVFSLAFSLREEEHISCVRARRNVLRSSIFAATILFLLSSFFPFFSFPSSFVFSPSSFFFQRKCTPLSAEFPSSLSSLFFLFSFLIAARPLYLSSRRRHPLPASV